MPNQIHYIHYIQNLSNCFKIHRTSEYVHHVNTQIIYINAFMHLFIHMQLLMHCGIILDN